MMPRRPLPPFPLALLAIFLAAALASCNRPTCDVSSFIAPSVFHYAEHETPSGWHLTWGAGEGGCRPRNYRLLVSETLDFAEVMASVDVPAEPGPGDSEYTELQADSSLIDFEPAHIYYWKAAGLDGTDVGPFSAVGAIHIGSECLADDDLGQLSLLSPILGAEVDTTSPDLQWTHTGNCLPAYLVCVAPSPLPDEWIQRIVEDQTPCLAWASTGSTSIAGIGPSEGLPDCTAYSWQVRAQSRWNPFAEIGILSEIGDFTINAAGTCCTSGLVPDAPTLASPAPYEIVHPTAPGPLVPHVTLAWENPQGACQPNGYAIQLAADHDFGDAGLNGEVSGPQTWYDVPVGLRAATQYWWKVAAHGIEGDGPFSPPRSFFTGPDCSAASQLTAPELISPEDGAFLAGDTATLHFQAGSPGCIPDGYYVDLQPSETFAGESLLGEFNQPGTTVITDPLEDCTDYYWRVAAVQDGVRGPFSETRTFLVSTTPFCPQQFAVTLINRDALCRLGPAMVYSVVDTWTAGAQVEVVGRSADAGWLVITRSSGRGTCFIKRELLDYAGDAATLPEIVAPPPPTPTAVPPSCSSDLNEAPCLAEGGVWTEKRASAGSYCACP